MGSAGLSLRCSLVRTPHKQGAECKLDQLGGQVWGQRSSRVGDEFPRKAVISGRLGGVKERATGDSRRASGRAEPQ